ncbi:hypothetical protein [Flavicella sp.]|uniref:hypothetical protein n=1 Tax=Flavicella sp. TaxID=2957742 RepID=UPI003019CB44
MKKYLFVLLCICYKFGLAQSFDDGVLSYTIIDSDNNYVSVVKYYNCPTGALIIPETVKHEEIIYTIISISDYTFVNCLSLTSVSIPEGVTSI